uniref:Putative secreted peptide n=1 Tax=Anopheles braziliensis TaxID=58242 RepID=A0A2M3ZTB4_9DIPT
MVVLLLLPGSTGLSATGGHPRHVSPKMMMMLRCTMRSSGSRTTGDSNVGTGCCGRRCCYPFHHHRCAALWRRERRLERHVQWISHFFILCRHPRMPWGIVLIRQDDAARVRRRRTGWYLFRVADILHRALIADIDHSHRLLHHRLFLYRSTSRSSGNTLAASPYDWFTSDGSDRCWGATTTTGRWRCNHRKHSRRNGRAARR